MLYCKAMLSGIRIHCSDTVWQKILLDFGATITNEKKFSDIDFDSIKITESITAVELKALILNAMDGTENLKRVFGKYIFLPSIQSQIVIWLERTGGMTADDLKIALGYAPETTSHTVDTAVYQLRKKYGADFIINDAGVYRLGKL